MKSSQDPIPWSYANVWEAKSINGGSEVLGIARIPKSDTKSPKSRQRLKRLTEGEAKQGNGKTVPPLPPSDPLRDGDTEDQSAYQPCLFYQR